MDDSSGGDCILPIINRRSARACSSERIFIRARCPYASTYLELNSSSWWAILRVITVDNAEVIAIRKIKPRAMPRIRFRIVGCSMEWRSEVADRMGMTRTPGRSGIGPGSLLSARRRIWHVPRDKAVDARPVGEYRIRNSVFRIEFNRHDPLGSTPQPDRPGLCPDPRGDYRPFAAAGASHPAERIGGKARRLAPAGVPCAASAAPAGTRRRKRPPRF